MDGSLERPMFEVPERKNARQCGLRSLIAPVSVNMVLA
jgi:hypothetical protein